MTLRKIFFLILKISVSGALIYFLLHRIGLRTVINSISELNLFWLIFALFLFSASHFIGSLQWWLILREEGVNISWPRTLSFYYTGLFFNNFFISSLGGDLVRMVDIKGHSHEGSTAVYSVFADRFIGLFVMSGMALLSIPYLLSVTQLSRPAALLVYSLPVLWFFVLFILFSKRFAAPLAWLIKKIIPGKITLKAREVYNKIYRMGRNRNLLVKILLLSFFVQSARITTHYFLARALGINVSPLYFFAFIPLIAIAASLPVSIGGLGLREKLGVDLFRVAGIPAGLAFSMEFTAYLVAIVTALPGGIMFALRGIIQSRRKIS